MAPDGPVNPGGADYRHLHLVPRSGGAVTAAAARLDPCGSCDCVAAAVVAVCCAGAGFVAAVVGSRIHCIALIVGMCLVLVVAVVGLLIVVVVGLVGLVGCFAAVGLDSTAGLGSTLFFIYINVLLLF